MLFVCACLCLYWVYIVLELHKNPSLHSMSTDTEKEIWKLKKDSIMEVIKKNQEKNQNLINSENLNSPFNTWLQWRKDNAYWDMKCNDLWDKVKKKELVDDIVNKNKLNILNYTEFLEANKQTVISELKNKKSVLINKPLGTAGDITVNELLSKGLDVIETPLVKMIRENIDVSAAGFGISSMIMFNSICKLFMKLTYGKDYPEVLKHIPSTKAKEVALFMLVGAPFVAGWMWTGNKIIGGKVVVNILANNELESTSSVRKNEIEGTSSISKSSFFLFLNKLPSWLKAILKYIALYFIGLFIVKVFGYNSNIINEISSQFSVYLAWFLKLYCILNLLVLIYFIWKLYIIVMFSQNKEYLNPEAYPKFIKNELIESKEIAIKIYLKNPGIIYKHYLKLIFLYISIVFFGVIVIILYTNS